MSQPSTWGVPRTDGGQHYTPEQYATRDADSLDALLSLHKGPSRPSYAVAGTLWIDDSSTPWQIKLFDGANDAVIGTISPSGSTFTVSGNAVSYAPQSLSGPQKAQARENIEAISYAAQTLSGSQQEQARANIGAERLPDNGPVDGDTDFDNLDEPGWQPGLYGAGNANIPSSGGFWHVLTVKFSSNVTQIAIPYSVSSSIQKGIYMRGRYSGVWSPWRKVAFADDVFPVGFTYIQYPGEATPSSLFGGTWSLIFNTEGIFFRTEGGNASAFGGGIQADEIKSHTHTGSTNTAGEHTHGILTGSSSGSTAYTRGSSYNTSQSTTAAGAHSHTLSIAATGGAETRPRNRTIRIWKKTAH